MIKIENVSIAGWEPAIRGMRNPMNSWEKSDSWFWDCIDMNGKDFFHNINGETKSIDMYKESELLEDFVDQYKVIVGQNDLDLMQRLAAGGSVHAKYRRMIVVYMDVVAPLYLWKEADTYKVATVAQSASTMHTIMHRELTQDDFEYGISPAYLDYLNSVIAEYRASKDEELFLELKNGLPEGFLQRRVWSLSLANMKNIYAQRRRHRLPQWQLVCQAFVEETPLWLRGIYGQD